MPARLIIAYLLIALMVGGLSALVIAHRRKRKPKRKGTGYWK